MWKGREIIFLPNKTCSEKLGIPVGLTWKGLQWDVREDVMATANHNCIKDSTLLLAVALGNNLPLARGWEIWVFFHTEDSCLERTQRKHYWALLWHNRVGMGRLLSVSFESISSHLRQRLLSVPSSFFFGKELPRMWSFAQEAWLSSGNLSVKD